MSTGMTTESTATESVPANGNAGDLLGTGKPGTPNRATHVRQNLRAGRDAIKAEFEAAEDDGPKPATVADAPADKADRDRAKDKAVVEAKDKPAAPKNTDDDETEDGEDKPAKVEAKAKEPSEDKPDAETSKRLASVQAAEKRSLDKLNAEREQVKAERAAAAKERAELEADRKELAAYKAAVARAKVDPVAALKALGVEDLDYAAKTAYAASKGDPANKEAAARLMRERERDERLERLEKQAAEREKADAEREQQAAITQRANTYWQNLGKAAAAGAASPLAKHFLDKDPDHTRAELAQIAIDLSRELDDEPDVDDVLARFEKKRRADLARYGVDPDSILKTEQKKPDPEATKKTVAKTLGNDLSTTNVPRTSTSEREHRRQLRAEFESGKLG